MISGERIDYPRIIEAALRDAVRRVLAEVAEHGLPGEHHFYLEFRTDHPGVGMPRTLRDLHPEEMQIILQHQFWNLEVDAEEFAVELSFGGQRQRLTVPFAALTAFADPSAELALRFTTSADGGKAAADDAAASGEPAVFPAAGSKPVSASGRPIPASGGSGKTGGEVIQFDPSRRR